jgi:hypothetical protein
LSWVGLSVLKVFLSARVMPFNAMNWLIMPL